MNSNEIEKLYNKMISMSTGVKKVKIDLHVHTPASYDFSYKLCQKKMHMKNC